jgi:branched-subunit amino acid transport protein AzlD
MNELEYLIVVIIVMALSTYFTRLIPFLLFSPGRESSLLNYVAKSTPPMVMMILVIYMLRDMSYYSFELVYTSIALAVTIGFQVYKRNALLSIVAGTAVYMFFVQI